MAEIGLERFWTRFRSHKWISLAAFNQVVFLSFLSMTMLSYAHQWNQGPFSWWAFPMPAALANVNLRIGPLSLLPAVALSGLVIDRIKDRSRRWSWGDRRVFWPLLSITLLALFHVLIYGHLTIGLAIGLFWFVYLFEVNSIHASKQDRLLRPGLIWIFVGIIIIQAMVGIAQFMSQREVGLTWLGEPNLDPYEPGISIVVKGNLRWLRAYGINSHPNRLGLKLTTLILLLWPYLTVGSRWKQAMIWSTLVIGVGGLLVTLSRSSWIGLVAGLGVYAIAWLLVSIGSTERWGFSRARLSLAVAFIAVIIVFTAAYGDTLYGRITQPSNEVEQRSVNDRVREIQVAIQLIRSTPLQGVGLGNSPIASRAVDPFTGTVHMVPLMVGVEMGLPGMALWLLLMFAPLVRGDLFRHYTPQAAAWVAILCFSMLQPEPTMFKLNMAVLFGLVTALWAKPGLPHNRLSW